MAEEQAQAWRDVAVPNREGLHARPVMRFVDLASTFASQIGVTNLSRPDETVDGKSAMQMMLLEATQGTTLRILADGPDAESAIESLVSLVKASFHMEA